MYSTNTSTYTRIPNLYTVTIYDCAKMQEVFLSRAQTTCHKSVLNGRGYFLAKNLEVRRNPTHGGELAASELSTILNVYSSMN